ncbi:MAG TPA: hypothetical protein GXX75_20980 [Clostridiales bacterium]|nr:hypothetical protein [Clostridiales bacterium]
MRISDSQFEKLLGYKPPLGYHPKGEPFTLNSTLGDMKDTWVGRLLLSVAKKGSRKLLGEMDDPAMIRMAETAILEAPLRAMKMASDGKLTDGKLEGIVDLANGSFFKGIGKLLSK